MGINGILKKVEAIQQKDQERKLKEKSKGAFFNVFSIMGLQTDEVRLHSSLMAELLRPDGSHGAGSKFLELFMDQLSEFGIQLSKYCFLPNAHVYAEYNIGNISDDFQKGGRIDILILDSCAKNAIIIENKIWATDQPFQLVRYANYAKDFKIDAKILYLSPNLKSPDKISIGDNSEKINFSCISYRDVILPWIRKCIVESNGRTNVTSVLTQYEQILKEILNMMDSKSEQELLDVISTPKNIRVARAIADNYSSALKMNLEKLAKDHYKCKVHPNSSDTCLFMEYNGYYITLGDDGGNLYYSVKTEKNIIGEGGLRTKLQFANREPSKYNSYGYFKTARKWEEIYTRDSEFQKYLDFIVEKLKMEIDNNLQ